MLPDFSHGTNVHNSLLTVALDNETFSASEKYIQCIINRKPEIGLLSNLLMYISNFFRKVRYPHLSYSMWGNHHSPRKLCL